MLINRKVNQHWMAAANVDGKPIEYDAFDRHSYLDKGYGDGFWNGADLEGFTEANCGQRSCAWLITEMSKN